MTLTSGINAAVVNAEISEVLFVLSIAVADTLLPSTSAEPIVKLNVAKPVLLVVTVVLPR